MHENNKQVGSMRAKKERKTRKWLNIGYIALAVGTSLLLWFCSVLLYK